MVEIAGVKSHINAPASPSGSKPSVGRISGTKDAGPRKTEIAVRLGVAMPGQLDAAI
jgi:hypothetical protein